MFVKVVAITGICIGSLSFLVDSAQLLSMSVRFRIFRSSAFTFYLFDRIFFDLVFCILAGLLVATSIGCLVRKEWGRIWIVRYAIVYLIACVVELILRPLIQMVPAMIRFGAVSDPQVYRFMLMDAARTLVIDAFTCALPIVILIYMTRPKVRASFSGVLSVSSDTPGHGC